MDCTTCLRMGRQRNGGEIGLCWTHAKRRCANPNCGKPSAGKEFCSECAYGADIKRWSARANLRLWEEERMEEFYAARKEKIMQSKFHFHEAVEVFTRGLLYVLEAIWSLPPRDAAELELKAEPKRLEGHEDRDAA